MLVVAIGVDQVSDLVDEIIVNNAAENLMLNPEGFGKKGSKEKAEETQEKINCIIKHDFSRSILSRSAFKFEGFTNLRSLLFYFDWVVIIISVFISVVPRNAKTA